MSAVAREWFRCHPAEVQPLLPEFDEFWRSTLVRQDAAAVPFEGAIKVPEHLVA